jgi:signal peptidase I
MQVAENIGTSGDAPPEAGRPQDVSQSLSRRWLWAATRRAAGALATLTAVAALCVLVVAEVGPRMGWFRVETVLSGSMPPTFSPGDLIVVTPEPTTSIRRGQIITYQIPVGDHHVETHRVFRMLRRGTDPVLVTKGDANQSPDPWRARLRGPTAWKLRWVVPGVGLLIELLRNPRVHLLTVIVLPAILAASWLGRIWRRPSEATP